MLAVANGRRFPGLLSQGLQIREQVGGLPGREVAEQLLGHERRNQRFELIDRFRGGDKLVPSGAADSFSSRQKMSTLMLRRRTL